MGRAAQRTYLVRPTFSATSTRSLLRWPRSQLLDVGADMAEADKSFV